jgi:hypothetical protein
MTQRRSVDGEEVVSLSRGRRGAAAAPPASSRPREPYPRRPLWAPPTRAIEATPNEATREAAMAAFAKSSRTSKLRKRPEARGLPCLYCADQGRVANSIS